jgi:hypothetical protein
MVMNNMRQNEADDQSGVALQVNEGNPVNPLAANE